MNKDYLKYLAYKALPLESYLKLMYKWYHGGRLDFDNPKRYSEKLFWLKKYNGENNLALIRKCYDKYRVREYMQEKGLIEHMPELYGVYNSPDEIDFSKFPTKYVIKISQSCGFNYINNGNVDIDEERIKQELLVWLNMAKDKTAMKKAYKDEHYYFDGNAVIICEEYLECKNGSPCVDMGVFCFNGEPMFACYDIDAIDENGFRKKSYYRNTYTPDWELIPVDLGRKRNEGIFVEKPKNFDKMIEISKIISKDFPFVRVDLYNRDGQIFLGEITFIPQGASQKILPIEFDYKFGEYLALPKLRNDK